ncbi:MAG: glycoside hydrolase family 13 protein, partial [Anaerolineae bacterium]|nr:glycoside hydrolase family 13 protein [Anaerolineae bacterium]
AIYFNPIFQSASNHRYHTHDYYQVDPILGGNKAFRKLLDAAHGRGMKVVLDGVFNHASRGFFQFNHLLECGAASPYLDWWVADEFPLNAYDPTGAKPNYGAWWDLPALPKLNTDTPAVREFIWSVAEYWVQFGIDGWRLDVPFEIDDDEFWREFRRRVKGANPEAYIVGELWEESHRWLAGDQFDAQMNYLFSRPAIAHFGRETLADLKHGPYAVDPVADAAEFAAAIEKTFTLYDWEVVQVQLNLLGSHDTPRYLTMVGEDESALKLGTLCQMTLPGAPCIYYGDELGLIGGYEPECRNAMPWDEVPALMAGDLWRAMRDAAMLRQRHKVLRRGTYTTVFAEGDLLAYRRDLGGQWALVAFNTARTSAPLTVPVPGDFHVALGQPLAVMREGDTVTLDMPARHGVVLAGG